MIEAAKGLAAMDAEAIRQRTVTEEFLEDEIPW